MFANIYILFVGVCKNLKIRECALRYTCILGFMKPFDHISEIMNHCKIVTFDALKDFCNKCTGIASLVALVPSVARLDTDCLQSIFAQYFLVSC